jgi:hypothetical protein
MEERKLKKNQNTILGTASSIYDTVKNKSIRKSKYKNQPILMEQDIEVTASSSKSTLNSLQSDENEHMEITPSKEATPERNTQEVNRETTSNSNKTSETNVNQQQEKEDNDKSDKNEKVNTNNKNKNFLNTGFIILDNSKGKEKENSTEQKEKENEEDTEIDDNKSTTSIETNLSEHEKWRIETNAKRYKAWIKLQSLKGKNTKEKTNYFLEELNNKIEWVNLSREKNSNEKGIYLTLTFNNEEELQKALDLELETNEENTKTKMSRAPLAGKNKYIITNSVVKFWDIPIKINRQVFLQMIENKFGRIKSNSTRINGLYQTCWIEFESQTTAEEILEQKSQIVGDECLRVTSPEIRYADLLKLKETGFAAKVIDVPPTMTPAELYQIMKQLGAQTCYMPITRNGNKKGIAILNFESQEILNEAVGKGYKVDQHMIRIVSADTKVCHQCKSIDHLVKDCEIAKENKEREFRQKQNYQRFGQTYKRYQPRVYNTLNNRYTNNPNTYADIARRRPNPNEQKQHISTQQNDSHNSNGNIIQMLENINRRLNRMEENLNNLNERVEHIQFAKECENQMQEDQTNNNYNENNEENIKQVNPLNNNNKGENDNTQNEIAQYLNQIMTKLGEMENQVINAHQRIDIATGNNYGQQMENPNNPNNY